MLPCKNNFYLTNCLFTRITYFNYDICVSRVGVPPGRACSESFGGSAVLAVRHALTGRLGEYLRVVGILSDGMNR